MVIWSNAALWKGPNNSIVQFGGEKVDVHLIPSPDPPLSVWSMTPRGNGNGTWNEIINSSDPLWNNLTRPNGGLHSQNSDLQSYYLGGFVSNWTSPAFENTSNAAPIPISGLVSYDPAKKSWKNTSSAGYSEYGNGIRGAMQATNIFGGSEGILVMMGGDIGGRSSHYVQGTALRGMDNITIYDITDDEWYHQTATGDIPPPRIDLCVVGASEHGSGTYEIFMTGGFNGVTGPENSGYNVSYVLTLPAFQWMRAGSATQPRAGHSCVVAGKSSQLIVVGGFDPSQQTLNASAQIPDPFAQGLGVFNMTSMMWQDRYDGAANSYRSSNQIKQWYNSSAVPA
ncbi:MAG: hypothetical protein M1830_002315 [Pleopsidium flavum]|nr:MAG: hypothetical protein M1830_002315 [Pleopsidium flavum]